MKNNELCAGVYVAQGPELNVLINLTGKAPMLSIISAIDLNAFFKEGMVRALNPSNIEIQDILMYPEKYQFETLNTSSTVNNLSGYDDGVNRDESSITEEFIEECTRKFKDIIKITNDFNMSKIKMKIWLKREHQMSISQGEAFIGKLMERMKPNL